jgi:sulfite reductase (ferredoxin)
VKLTPQQDLLLCDVSDRAALEGILAAGGVARPEKVSVVRRNAMACPAKPTCGLAMTEAERILPRWIDGIEAAGFGDVDVVIRMTGCPNMCARPPTAEIGIFGYGKNDHVVLVGGSREGSRLGHELYARVPGERMIEVLVGLLRAIRSHNPDALPAGELLHRTPPERLREWIGVADG